MNFGKFQQYLEDFNNTISLDDFLINLLVVTALSVILQFYYIRFGNSVTNRMRFSGNFLPLALTTMLIITIVKSNIALSLGLVGALSIVRFRAAIKDPEELTYLFLVIGIGLATGANQPLLALIAIASILGILYGVKRFQGKIQYKSEDKLYVNVSTDLNDLARINKILIDNFHYVELKRMDTLGTGLDLAFVCKARNIEEIDSVRHAITSLSPLTSLSIVDQPDLVV